MAKHRRFVFDAENFHFGEAPRKIWRAVLRLVLYMLMTLTLAVLTYGVFALFFRTDTERRLRREIRLYERLYPELEARSGLLEDAIADLQHKDDRIYDQVFHASAPGLDPMEAMEESFAVADSIPAGELVGYTAHKADSLLAHSADVEAAFKQIFGILSDPQTSLPPMILPIKDITYPQVGASTGRKINPFYKAYVYHEGLDLIVTRGTPVLATADGTVVTAASSRTTGNTVRIRHDGGYETVYAHLESMSVRAGQRVRTGQKVGAVGMSGQAVAPHLHYEVRKDGVAVNPVGCFFASVSSSEFANMLYMSVNTMQSMD